MQCLKPALDHDPTTGIISVIGNMGKEAATVPALFPSSVVFEQHSETDFDGLFSEAFE